MVDADAKTELTWLLEGHSLKANDNSYVKPSEQKLYQEYEKALDNLTIDPNQRLQKKVEISLPTFDFILIACHVYTVALFTLCRRVLAQDFTHFELGFERHSLP